MVDKPVKSKSTRISISTTISKEKVRCIEMYTLIYYYIVLISIKRLFSIEKRLVTYSCENECLKKIKMFQKIKVLKP